MDYLPRHRHLFRPLETLGEAMREAVKARWRRDAAKEAARAWDLEISTAENLLKGHASARTLAKAVKAEGREAWALWDAIGELFIGESRDQFEERKLQTIIEETELARTRLEDRRHRRLALEVRTARLGEMADR